MSDHVTPPTSSDSPKKALTPRQAAFVAEYLVDLNGTQAAIRAGCRVLRSEVPVGYYVYALVDPQDSSVFYVGKGKGKRWLGHYKERFTGSGKHQRLSKISEKCCVVVSEGLTEAQALSLEKETIAALACYLTNVAWGHELPLTRLQKSMETCKQMAATIIPFDVWLQRKPRTSEQISMYHALVAQIKKIALVGDLEAEWHRWDAQTRTWKRVLKSHV